MSSNEIKNKSFRLLEEGTEKIGEMLKGRQITINQLFEEFILLAEQKEIAPKLSEEDVVLEAEYLEKVFLHQQELQDMKAKLEQIENELVQIRQQQEKREVFHLEGNIT